MVQSLHGEVADVVSAMGFESQLDDILKKIGDRFGEECSSH